MKLKLIGHDPVAELGLIDAVLNDSYVSFVQDDENSFPDPFEATASSEDECFRLFGHNLNGVQ